MISPLLQVEIWHDRVNQLLDRCRDGFLEGWLVERHGFALDGIHTLFSTSSPTFKKFKMDKQNHITSNIVYNINGKQRLTQKT